jgi:hypothetical protein
MKKLILLISILTASQAFAQQLGQCDFDQQLAALEQQDSLMYQRMIQEFIF